MSNSEGETIVRSSTHRLASLFEPRSIAMVGLSDKSFWGYLINNVLESIGYEGKLFAINREGRDVYGIKGYAACTEIGEPADVAFILLGQHLVLDSLENIAEAGIRNVVVLAAGYAEIGPEGAKLQDELVERAKSLGLNMWGPNSLGFNNVGKRCSVSSIQVTQPLLPPSVAIVAQSGATVVELADFAHGQNIGPSFLSATGNEAMITIADLVDYLVDHEETRAIAIFCEAIRDPVGFIRAAERAREAGKGIVILKIGRSELAGSIAQAHTGSLVGDDKAFSAICERIGIIRVRTAEDLIATAGLIAATGPLEAPGITFVSTSGGSCTLVADGAEEAGVYVPAFTPDLKERLQAELPGFAATNNPLDITGAWMTDAELIARVLPVVADHPEVGLVIANMILPTREGEGFPAGLPPLGRALGEIDKPSIIATTVNRVFTQYSRDEVAEHGLPHVVCGVDRMLRAVSQLAWWSRQAGKHPALPLIAEGEQSDGPVIRGERAVLGHLADAGVPVIPGEIAAMRADAERIAAELGGALALKIASPDIAHKTEVGGVRLGVDAAGAGDAFDEILASAAKAAPDAQIDGVIVSPMRTGGVELLVGITRDPDWGLMLSVGLGGVLVEVMADVVTAPLPVEKNEVKEMLGRLRGARLLEGYRGAKTAGLDATADAIAAIASAAAGLGGNLESLEVNPLLVGEDRVEALDALAIWKE